MDEEDQDIDVAQVFVNTWDDDLDADDSTTSRFSAPDLTDDENNDDVDDQCIHDNSNSNSNNNENSNDIGHEPPKKKRKCNNGKPAGSLSDIVKEVKKKPLMTYTEIYDELVGFFHIVF